MSHVSGKNANLPILNNILFRADVSGLKLTTTNLDLTVTCTVRGKVDQPGEYTVPAKLITEYVGLLPDDRVDIDLLDTALSLVCGKATTKMNGLPANDFPLVPGLTGGRTFRVAPALLDAALGQTLFAVSTSEARQILTGALLAFDSATKKVTVAATDSYRLGERAVELVGDIPDGERRVVVPARALGEVRRILGVLRDAVDAPEQVEIEVGENQVAFRMGGVELLTRTIDGVYPDYRQIIPTGFVTEVTLDRVELMQAVRRAALFSKAGLFDVRIGFHPDAKEITLLATDVGRGEHAVSVRGEVTGKENVMTLNYRYLLDGLAAMSTPQVVVKVIDATNPCLLLPKDDAADYCYIVMPIRQ